MTIKKQCDECRWCILHDHGYSNYTVEGTDVICTRFLHPKQEFDRWYGENDKDLSFAEQCSAFEPGEPFQMDVDGEWTLNDMDAQQREAYNMYTTKQMLLGRI